MRHATGIITEKLHVARLYCNALFNLNETPIMINYTENYILRAARLTGKSNDSHLQQSSLLQRAMCAMTSNKNCSKSMNTHTIVKILRSIFTMGLLGKGTGSLH